MTAIVFVLCLFINEELVEHRIQDNLSTCLKMKREATRNINMDNKQFMCGEVEAELETNIDGSKTIKRIINNK
jgi:hypothetical protein